MVSAGILYCFIHTIQQEICFMNNNQHKINVQCIMDMTVCFCKHQTMKTLKTSFQ